jgi:drug/metabolite transporter (DMT)-like permease
MNWTAITTAIIGFGFWGLFLDLAAKRLNPGSTQLAYSSTNVIFTLMLTWVLSKMGRPITLNAPGVGWAAAASMMGVLGGYSTVVALEKTRSPGVVNAVIHAAPVVTLLLTVLFVGETISLKAGCGLAMIMAGLALISR